MSIDVSLHLINIKTGYNILKYTRNLYIFTHVKNWMILNECLVLKANPASLYILVLMMMCGHNTKFKTYHKLENTLQWNSKYTKIYIIFESIYRVQIIPPQSNIALQCFHILPLWIYGSVTSDSKS